MATTGTAASRQAYKTDGLSSGNVLCTCTTSGRHWRSRTPSPRRLSGFQTTFAGIVAFRRRDQVSMSSLNRSNLTTSWPSSASAAPSMSTTRFSPLGAADR